MYTNTAFYTVKLLGGFCQGIKGREIFSYDDIFIIVFFGMAAMPLPELFSKMKRYRNCPKPFKYQHKYKFKLKATG